MSSLAVRTYFRNELNAWLAVNSPTTPFHETINTRQDPKDDLWVTLDFITDYSEDLTIGCDSTEERGSVDIYVYGRAGKGDGVVLTLAEALAKGFKGLRTPQIIVTSVEPVQEVFGSDVVHWYGVMVGVDYSFTE